MSFNIGAKTVEQLDFNLAGADLTLTPEEVKSLDDLSAIAPEWMFAMQGSNRVPKPFVDG